MNREFLQHSEEIKFDIFEYIKENAIGLILLVLAFFIIYFVDYINQLNAMIYSSPSIIPGLTSNGLTPQINSKRKFKKR